MKNKKARIAVLISGEGTNLQALIDACNTVGFPAEIVRVISNSAAAPGLKRAKTANIEFSVMSHNDYPSREEFDQAMHAQLSKDRVDLVCLAGFMRMLSEPFVKLWHNKLINIHPSLLPSFKGIHAVEDALKAGVRFTGCTAHFVRAAMDDGPIIIQAAVPVFQDDTVETLKQRIHEAEHECYPLAVRLIASSRLTIQNDQMVIKGRIPEVPYVINYGFIMNPA